MKNGKVNWGILSTAKIGTVKVIPAMQAGRYSEIAAIASRDIRSAEQAAATLHIPKAYGSYQELLNDPEIDAVYIPLPNDLHVEWSIRALRAGKHVLCEKPLGLSAADAQLIVEAAEKYPQLKVMEAFMYRFHPQWAKAKQLADEGYIGKIGAIQAFFSYYNVDPSNIRNQPQNGGGALLDIGCYCISQSRFILGSEPARVIGSVSRDPELGTDRLSSALLEFPGVISSFTCSTQLDPYQRFNIIGSGGRIEVEVPVNTSPEGESRIWLHTQNTTREILFEACNQYTLQGDVFSKVILDEVSLPVSLADAVKNMQVIDAIFESAASNGWVTILS